MSSKTQEPSIVSFWWKNSSTKHRSAGLAFILVSFLYAYISYSVTLFFTGGEPGVFYPIALVAVLLIQGLPSKMADAVSFNPKADMGIRFVAVSIILFFFFAGSMIAVVQNLAFA
jgi:hypothetical protein